MNLQALTEPQRNALVDLLVLGMYSDGHLAAVEELKIRQAIGSMGVEGEPDIDRALDASVTRVRQHAGNAQAASAYATRLAQAFPARDQRRQAHDLVNAVLESDRHITSSENELATVVREALRL